MFKNSLYDSVAQLEKLFQLTNLDFTVVSLPANVVRY